MRSVFNAPSSCGAAPPLSGGLCHSPRACPTPFQGLSTWTTDPGFRLAAPPWAEFLRRFAAWIIWGAGGRGDPPLQRQTGGHGGPRRLPGAGAREPRKEALRITLDSVKTRRRQTRASPRLSGGIRVYPLARKPEIVCHTDLPGLLLAPCFGAASR